VISQTTAVMKMKWKWGFQTSGSRSRPCGDASQDCRSLSMHHQGR